MHRTTPGRAAAAAAVLALATGLAACGDDADTPAAAARPAGQAVQIKTFMFDPEPVRVTAGTTVTWKNQDDILHTVTDGPRGKPTGDFDAQLRLGDTFRHRFSEAGTYRYVCTIHRGMDGTVVVR